MKYTLINRHSNINFHDAYVNSVYFQNNNMVWELAALQATNIEFPKKREDDYYIKNATMILENACIEDIFIGGMWQNKNGVMIVLRENRNASPDEYDELLENVSYKNWSYIYGIKDLPTSNEGIYRVSVVTTYEITISFTKSIVMWNEFAGSEWYHTKHWANWQPN